MSRDPGDKCSISTCTEGGGGGGGGGDDLPDFTGV